MGRHTAALPRSSKKMEAVVPGDRRRDCSERAVTHHGNHARRKRDDSC